MTRVGNKGVDLGLFLTDAAVKVTGIRFQDEKFLQSHLRPLLT